MATTVDSLPLTAYERRDPRGSESKTSGVSWGAVIAGAFVTAALTLILLALGTGIGLSAMVWGGGNSGRTVGFGAIIWLMVVEVLACGLGGYLAGRLRTRWVSLHTHEVYFRDTAHGFLVWATSLVISAAFLTSAAASMVGAGAATNTPGTPSAMSIASGSRVMAGAYFSDALFRTNNANPPQNQAVRDEASVILLNGIASRDLTPEDRTYLIHLVSLHTGLNGGEATSRVSDVFNEDLAAADAARKAAAHSLYWTFVALLIGAFVASHAATVGGRQRDRAARSA
jgi:hypothetical protein